MNFVKLKARAAEDGGLYEGGLSMEDRERTLTAEQYHTLYTKAFAKLADISSQAERAMRELEELQLTMGDK